MNIYRIETSQKDYHVKADNVKQAYELVSNCLVNNRNIEIKSITLICTLNDTNEA